MFTPPEIPLNAYTAPQTDIYLPSVKAPSSEYPHKYDSYGSVNNYVDNAYTPIQQYQTPTYSQNEFQRAASAGPQPAPTCKMIHHSNVRIIHLANSIDNINVYINIFSIDVSCIRSTGNRRCKISPQNHLHRHQSHRRRSLFSINRPSHTNHQSVVH